MAWVCFIIDVHNSGCHDYQKARRQQRPQCTKDSPRSHQPLDFELRKIDDSLMTQNDTHQFNVPKMQGDYTTTSKLSNMIYFLSFKVN